MNNIVLIGMPGTGKSVVGQALASRLGYEFVDVDDLIVEKAGKTLPEILRQDGLEAFYKIEGQVGLELERTHTVIATGGSMVLYPEAMAHLKEGSVVVWLQTPFTQKMGLLCRGGAVRDCVDRSVCGLSFAGGGNVGFD